LQKDNLAESTLGIGRILKGVKILLKSNDLLGALVNSFPYDTVSTLPYNNRQRKTRLVNNTPWRATEGGAQAIENAHAQLTPPILGESNKKEAQRRLTI